MKPVLVIGGPTASGKSGLALSVAQKKNGVIINADSMQLYQGLPILTALPSAADMALIPHKLYACFNENHVCSAAAWRDLALEEIEKAHAEKKLPIIVGGTGFYIKTLIKGLSPIPDIPHGLRGEISALQKKLGNPAFHEELKKRDPAMAEKLHPFNTQRLIRAWEVLEATGKSLAVWQSIPPVPPPAHLEFIMVTLLPKRDQLHRNCNTRFDQMMAAGALNEVRSFKEKTLPGQNAPLLKALGYPELSAHLEGKLGLEEAVSDAKTSTRHYAKRQVTWFKHQLESNLVLEKPDTVAVLKLSI